MFGIIMSVISAAVCWKWGDWKRWRDYYPTILYAIIGDLSYNFIFCDYNLWKYESFAGHTISDIFIAFTLFPSIIILFLTYRPGKILRQVLYIIAWSGALSLLEFIYVITGSFSHCNEWTIFWSFGVYAGAFILIGVHIKHPLIVWPVSGLLALLTAIIFGLPFELIK